MTPPTASPDATGSPPRTRGARRLARTAMLVLSVVVVLSAALLVPMPFVESAPGGVTEIAPLLEVEDAPGTVNGSLGLLTVRVDQPSALETLRAWVDDTRVLRNRDDVIPQDLSHRTYIDLQQQEFRRSFRVAAAAGLAATGRDVVIRTAPQVAGVLPGGPADGRLQIGDVIRRLDDTPVASTDDLITLTRQAAVGDRLVVDVERKGEPTTITIEAGRVPGLDHAAIGVTLQTLAEGIDLPVDVALVDQRGIGGPSAGLMVALTVYDLVEDEDLAAGRRIVGTGTVDGDGRVGRIGSIREKALAAVAGGADIMLAPTSQAQTARLAAEGHVEVIGVTTVAEAVEALRS